MVSANRFDRIYEELAKKYGRSKREIKNICDSPFLMLREFYKFASKSMTNYNNILLDMKSFSLQRVYIIILSKSNTAHPYYFMRKH